jgi:hypothetical protein
VGAQSRLGGLQDARAAARAASTTDRSPASTSIAIRACPVQAPRRAGRGGAVRVAAPGRGRQGDQPGRLDVQAVGEPVDGVRPVAAAGPGDDVDDAVQGQVGRGGEVGLGAKPP